MHRSGTMISRRTFLHGVGMTAAGVVVSSTAKSYAQIAGANERTNFAVIGLHSRAYAHLSALRTNASHSRVTHICDVESNFLQKYADATQKQLGYTAATSKD